MLSVQQGALYVILPRKIEHSGKKKYKITEGGTRSSPTDDQSLTFKTSLKTGCVVFFFTDVFILLCLSGWTWTLTYLWIRGDVWGSCVCQKNFKAFGFVIYIEGNSLRVALPLLAVSVSEISAGTHSDFQTGRWGVVGHSQLQLSSNMQGLERPTVCADAAATALKRRNTEDTSEKDTVCVWALPWCSSSKRKSEMWCC